MVFSEIRSNRKFNISKPLGFRPNTTFWITDVHIKFGLIGLKLAEISSFEHQYFSIPKNALQADSVQVSQIRAPNVENHAK